MSHEYPTDMKVDQDTLNVFLGDDGDMATITGLPNLEQSTAIVVRGETQRFVGSRITSTSVGLLEQRVAEALDDDEQIADVLSVSVVQFDQGSDTVTMNVRTTEAEYEFGVTA